MSPPIVGHLRGRYSAPMALISPPGPDRPYALVESSGTEGMLDVDTAEATALFKQHGALLFRGFGADVPAFRNFAKQFCTTSVLNESPGRSPLDPANNVYSVDGGNDAFPLHPELSREPWRPDAAFFGCIVPPAVGGETTICDGVELVRLLPDAVREGLQGRRLIYFLRTWPELLHYWLGTADPDDAQLAVVPPSCPYLFRRIEGRVMRAFSRPALYRPIFSSELAFGNFLLFARYHNGRRDFPVLDDGRPVPDHWMDAIKAVSDRITVPIRWQKGDVLMLDNSRFMHGRTAIPDKSDRMIATYFGYLEFAPPDPEEPSDPVWRREDFRPPIHPAIRSSQFASGT